MVGSVLMSSKSELIVYWYGWRVIDRAAGRLLLVWANYIRSWPGHLSDTNPSILYGTQLSSAQLSSAQLSSAQLNSTQLSSAQLSSAQLSSTQLSSAQLNSAQLSSAQLNSAQLSSTQLNSATPTPTHTYIHTYYIHVGVYSCIRCW